MSKRIISLILCLLMLAGVIPLSALSVSAVSTPVITVEYADASAYRGDFCEVILSVECDEKVTYQWQKGFADSPDEMVDLPENDIYKGVNTNHFKLKAIDNLWVYDYRCKITYSGGTVYTDTFIFMFLDPLPIETAQVTGLEKPKFGYTPDDEIDYVNSYKYQNGYVEWYVPNYDGTGWVKMNSTDVFVEGTYKCRVYLDPVEGYTFNEDSHFCIEGVNCVVTKTTNSEGKDVFYAERYYTVNYDGTFPEGLLDLEWRTPDVDDNGTDNYLGICYLGTEDMNIGFSFKPKALPKNMARIGYYVSENTRIANIRNQALYYANEGTYVNFGDIVTEKGKYYVEQTIYLMSPDDERLAYHRVSYVIDVLEPETVTSAGITFNAFSTWTKPFYTYVARTPGIEFNTMLWYDVTDGKSQINGDTNFIPGHTYRMEIWIKAKTGYVFSVDEDGCPDITAKVNGMAAEVNPVVSNTAAELVFEFTYEGKGILGDANQDGKVNVKDATAIQKHIASLSILTDSGVELADVNQDTKVNVKDATAIQKHIAGMDTGYDIGKEI